MKKICLRVRCFACEGVFLLYSSPLKLYQGLVPTEDELAAATMNDDGAALGMTTIQQRQGAESLKYVPLSSVNERSLGALYLEFYLFSIDLNVLPVVVVRHK